jgi:mitofilin
VVKGSTGAVVNTYHFFSDLITGTAHPSEKEKVAIDQKAREAKSATIKVIKQTTQKVEPTSPQAKKEVKETVNKVTEMVGTAAGVAADRAYDYLELIARAEAAIAGKPYTKDTPSPPKIVETQATPDNPAVATEASKNVYDLPLPLGFEPPPGFARPAPPKSKPSPETPKPPKPEPIVLPLVAPVVSTSSEPIISHLAGTIDNLASYLKSDPDAAKQAGDVLETAKGDLTALVERIEAVKEQERSALEGKLDEQTRDYTLKLLELEMEAQDKLDDQEEGYKQLFEQERAKFVQEYREKLNHELQIQTELINER